MVRLHLLAFRKLVASEPTSPSFIYCLDWRDCFGDPKISGRAPLALQGLPPPFLLTTHVTLQKQGSGDPVVHGERFG